MITKICNKCGLELKLESFYKRSKKENDYKNACKSCESKRISKNYQDNKDIKDNYHSIYRKINSEQLKNKAKIYRVTNKEQINNYYKNRKEYDVLFRLSCNLRIMINNACRRNGYTKKSKTCDILNCTFEEFKNHIESKWESWMTWNNYGLYNGELNYGWDIDHIIPLITAKTEEELLKLNHYNNLQPLCSYINRYIKKDKH